MKKVVYSFVVADLFHYGHLQLLQTAKSLGDLHICGVLTDEAAESYRPRPISNLEERLAIISSVNSVDRVVIQKAKDPTENLKKIRREFPCAELILVHGDDWATIPGRAYVESIGGRVVQPEYYRRLSDTRIREALARQGGQGSMHYELFTEHFRVGDIVVFDGGPKHFIMSTKANTLKSLRPLLKKSRIEKIFTFRVGDWQEDGAGVLRRIREEFAPEPVAVRSSAVNEDTYHSSQAGSYRSELDVSTKRPSAPRRAIESVVRSYFDKGNLSPANQVLVQPHVRDVRSSGVVFTRNPRTGAPYYVISYDDRTGQTKSVTAGLESEAIEIFRGCPPERWPAEWRPLLAAIRELEEIIPDTPLDVEFGIEAGGQVVVFQVRPLVLAERCTQEDLKGISRRVARLKERFCSHSRPVRHLAGETTVFSDMAFWNPAEMIGDRPAALALSLYKYLITDAVWHEALWPLGYAKVGPARLLVELGGKPYIDLRATFNALFPAGLPPGLRRKLVRHYIRKIRARPELHDKVEFEVADNCYNFTLPRRLRALERVGFGKGERVTLLEALRRLTASVLESAPEHFRRAEVACRTMMERRERTLAALEAQGRNGATAGRLAGAAMELLADCKRFGTLPFSQVARMAFMAKSLLGALVEAGHVGKGFPDAFLDQLNTVAKRMSEDFRAAVSGELSREAFMRRYGHLRPGTYDICSPRYDSMPDFFNCKGLLPGDPPRSSRGLALSADSRARIDRALRRHGLGCAPEELFRFIRAALEEREMVKFEFTKNLSEALELVARAGEELGLSREELAHLDVPALRCAAHLRRRDAIPEDWSRTIERNRGKKALDERLSLPPLLFAEADLEVVRRYRSKPNFITHRKVCGNLAYLSEGAHGQGEDLKGRIVLLEKADPGYDWIFTKSIAGLITKYGGVASHMAIRCAEFGLPAAIGCGEQIYQSLMRAKAVVLDCEMAQLKVV